MSRDMLPFKYIFLHLVTNSLKHIISRYPISRNKTNSECSSILLYIFVTRYFKRLHYGKKERKEREKGRQENE